MNHWSQSTFAACYQQIILHCDPIATWLPKRRSFYKALRSKDGLGWKSPSALELELMHSLGRFFLVSAWLWFFCFGFLFILFLMEKAWKNSPRKLATISSCHKRMSLVLLYSLAGCLMPLISY